MTPAKNDLSRGLVVKGNTKHPFGKDESDETQSLYMSKGISDAVNDLATDMNTSLAPEITVRGVSSTGTGTAGVSGSNSQTTINIYPQTLDQATIDYLYLKFNARLGAAI